MDLSRRVTPFVARWRRFTPNDDPFHHWRVQLRVTLGVFVLWLEAEQMFPDVPGVGVQTVLGHSDEG